MAGFEKAVFKHLRKAGFAIDRRPRGSHDVWANGDGHEVSVPSKIKKRATANGVLKQAGIDVKLP